MKRNRIIKILRWWEASHDKTELYLIDYIRECESSLEYFGNATDINDIAMFEI